MFNDSDVCQNSNNHFIEFSKHTKTIIKPTEYKKIQLLFWIYLLRETLDIVLFYCSLFCVLGSSDTHITVDPLKRTARGFDVMVANSLCD